MFDIHLIDVSVYLFFYFRYTIRYNPDTMSSKPKVRCLYCGKEFSNRGSCVRHTKGFCSVARESGEDPSAYQLPPRGRPGRPKIKADKPAGNKPAKVDKPIDKPTDNPQAPEPSAPESNPDENVTAAEPNPDENQSQSDTPSQSSVPSASNTDPSFARENAEIQKLISGQTDNTDPLDAEIEKKEAEENIAQFKAAAEFEKRMKREAADKKKRDREKAAAIRAAARDKATRIKAGTDIDPGYSAAGAVFNVWMLVQSAGEKVWKGIAGVSARMRDRKQEYVSALDATIKDIVPEPIAARMSGPKSKLAVLVAEDYSSTYLSNLVAAMPLNLPSSSPSVPANPTKVKRPNKPRQSKSGKPASKPSQTPSPKSQPIDPLLAALYPADDSGVIVTQKNKAAAKSGFNLFGGKPKGSAKPTESAAEPEVEFRF